MNAHRFRRLRRFAAVLVATLLLGTVAATAVLELSLAEMLDRADLILYGQVREVVSEPSDEGGQRTRVVLDVDRDLAEPGAPRDDVVLHFDGGQFGDDAVTVEGVPVFEPGERVLVLAYDEDDLVSPIVGVWQGLWRLGSAGLTDERGRLLTPTPDGIAPDGEGGDLTRILDAFVAVLAGEGEIAAVAPVAPAPEAADPDDVAAEDPAEDAADDAADDPADGPEQDPAAPSQEPDADGGAETQVVRLREPDDDALRTTVEDAAAAWREAGVDVRIEWDAAAADRVASADPAGFGPDALSLTLRRSGEAGVDILVRADLVATATGVLAYELAGLVGAPREDDGVLSGRFAAGGASTPSAGDAARLRAALDRLPGDLDGDGDVDFYDLVLLAEAYGRTGERSEADLDGSGEVDDADLEWMRDRYRFLPPSPDPPAGRTSGAAN